MDGRQLKSVAEFKFLEFMLDESGTYGAEYCRTVVVGTFVNGEKFLTDYVRYCIKSCLCLF